MSSADKFRKPSAADSLPSAVDLLIDKGGSVTPTPAQPNADTFESSALQISEADALIKNYVIAAMAMGLVAVPLLDLLALVGLQLKLLRDLCDHYKVDYSESLGRSWIYALIAGCAPVAATATFGSVLRIVPGFGTVAGVASITVLSGAFTHAVGKVFSRHFQAGGDLQNFRPFAVREEFRRAYSDGRRVARNAG